MTKRILGLLGLSLILLSSCVAPSEPGPVAETFLKALQGRDYATALSFADSGSKEKLLAIKSIAQGLSPEDQAVLNGIGPGAIELVSVLEDNGRYHIEWTLDKVRGDDFWVVREADKWKVAWQARTIFP